MSTLGGRRMVAMSRLGVVTLLLLLLFSTVSVQAQQRALPPTGLTVSGTTSTTISLTWTAPADDGHGAIQGYNVYGCEEGDAPCTPVRLGNVGSATTSYTHSSLTKGKTYRFAVGSHRGPNTQESVWSEVTAVADPLPQLPPPTGLRVSGTTATTISLTWTAPADDGKGDLDGYLMTGICDEGTNCDFYTSFRGDGTSYTQGNVIEGRTYRIKVEAWRDTVLTAPTNWVSATAGIPPSQQAPAPTGLTVDGTALVITFSETLARRRTWPTAPLR